MIGPMKAPMMVRIAIQYSGHVAGLSRRPSHSKSVGSISSGICRSSGLLIYRTYCTLLIRSWPFQGKQREKYKSVSQNCFKLNGPDPH